VSPDWAPLAASAVALLLGLAGSVVRDVRTVALGAVLAVCAGVSVPAGTALLGLAGPWLTRSPRRRRIAARVLAVALPGAAAAALAVALMPDAPPVLTADGWPATALLGAGMAGLAYAGMGAQRVWRRSRRHRDLISLAGVPLLAAALVAGPVVAWDAARGAWVGPVTGLAVLMVMAAPLLDTHAVLTAARRHRHDDEPMVELAERGLGVQLRGLLETAARRDPLAGEHSRRVAGLAVQVAERLGLSGRLQGQAAAAGLLHHLGAVRGAGARPAVAGDVLLAALAAPLAPAVRAAVRDQGEALAALEERYTEQAAPVPIVTRILTVCDAFDTLAREEGTPAAAAIDRLRAGAGERYCPAVLEALTAVLEGGLHEVVDEPAPGGDVPDQAGPAAR